MATYTASLARGEQFYDGLIKSVLCPSTNEGVESIILTNYDGSAVGAFTLCDATGARTADAPIAWESGMYIQVRFDLSNQLAQVLNAVSKTSVSEIGAVPSTREINGKPLTADVNLTAADIGAVPSTREINGKPLTADVNLTAADIGAMPIVDARSADYDMDAILLGGQHNAIYLTNANTLGTPYKYGVSTFINSMIISYAAFSSPKQGFQIAITNGAKGVYLRRAYSGTIEEWGKFYTSIDKPTAADVGAVNINGDTVKGHLGFSSANNGYGRIYKNHSDTSDYGTVIRDYAKDGKYISLALLAKNNALDVVDIDGNTHHIYHTGNKPTAADVGAIPTTGKPSGTYTGTGAARTINTGGVGKVLLVWRTTNTTDTDTGEKLPTVSIITPVGAANVPEYFYGSNSGASGTVASVLKFENGVLTAGGATLNATGVTYNYQVL